LSTHQGEGQLTQPRCQCCTQDYPSGVQQPLQLLSGIQDKKGASDLQICTAQSCNVPVASLFGTSLEIQAACCVHANCRRMDEAKAVACLHTSFTLNKVTHEAVLQWTPCLEACAQLCFLQSCGSSSERREICKAYHAIHEFHPNFAN